MSMQTKEKLTGTGNNLETIMRKKKFIFIAGLCVIENEEMTFEVAQKLKEITSKYDDVEFIFKASFDKANRTSGDSYRGVGMYEGMKILQNIKNELGIKVLTDVHHPYQANIAMDTIDVIQIPAFLCRQTDLVTAVGKTGKTVNIKKGQFIAPEDVRHIIMKLKATGNQNIMITERGTCFGYHNLIVDYRSFLILKEFGYPVIFDATHSQQKPSADGKQTGGNRDYVIPMACGAIATGADGLFVECHPYPPEAKSDSATSLYLEDIEKLLERVMKIWRVTNEKS